MSVNYVNYVPVLVPVGKNTLAGDILVGHKSDIHKYWKKLREDGEGAPAVRIPDRWKTAGGFWVLRKQQENEFGPVCP